MPNCKRLSNADLALKYEDVIELLTLVDANDIDDDDLRIVVRAVQPLLAMIERKIDEGAEEARQIMVDRQRESWESYAGDVAATYPDLLAYSYGGGH